MSESKMSYLRGFDANNYYSKPGLFRGSMNPGFAVAAMFRSSYPFQTHGDVVEARNICGNMVQTGVGTVAGWNMTMATQAVGGLCSLNFNFGDGTGTPKTIQTVVNNGVTSQRTFMYQIFMGLTLTQGKENEGAMIFLNGTLVALVDVLTGYTPPPSDAPFRIGLSNSIPALGTNDDSFGFAGFSWQDQVCANPASLDSYAQVTAIVAAQWADINAAEDMRDGGQAIISDVYSVRRGQPNPAATWAATKGSTSLVKSGSALFVEACKPRYMAGGWCQGGLL